MKVLDSTLAKIVLEAGWDTNPTLAAHYLFVHKLNVTEKQAGRLYVQLLDSGLVKQEWNNEMESKARWILEDGITEEML